MNHSDVLAVVVDHLACEQHLGAGGSSVEQALPQRMAPGGVVVVALSNRVAERKHAQPPL
jgi:hypothetical protein